MMSFGLKFQVQSFCPLRTKELNLPVNKFLKNNFDVERNLDGVISVFVSEACLSKTVFFLKLIGWQLKKKANCLIIYIKKPYFCVPKLETQFIYG